MFALPISVNYSIIILRVWQNDESSMNNWDNLFAVYTNKYRDKIKSQPMKKNKFDRKSKRTSFVFSEKYIYHFRFSVDLIDIKIRTW